MRGVCTNQQYCIASEADELLRNCEPDHELVNQIIQEIARKDAKIVVQKDIIADMTGRDNDILTQELLICTVADQKSILEGFTPSAIQ